MSSTLDFPARPTGSVTSHIPAGVAEHAFSYRPDIDGLRAVAVLLVVVFHAFPNSMRGGFIGVDVFFVISGYLISGIIFGQLANSRFSIADFYVRRVRRIFPALLLVMAASLLAGWFILLPDEFAKLGKHAAAGAAFLSNVVLWREAGYFDDDAALKPFLHLWSLGVEEQFYLAWPLILALVWRWRGRALVPILALASLSAASFVANIAFIDRSPTAVFFLPFTRFWELMIGAMLAYQRMAPSSSATAETSPVLRSVASWCGLLAIAGAAAVIDKSSRFPGFWALLPAMGAALILWAGPQAAVNRSLLSMRPVVYIGLISYPLYLWHWPLLALARIWTGDELSMAAAGALAASAVALAALTYHFVETPIRGLRSHRQMRTSAVVLVAIMVLVAATAALVWLNKLPALSSRFPHMAEVAIAANDIGYHGDRTIVGRRPSKVLMFGDSHMQQYMPRAVRLLADQSLDTHTVVFHTMGGCAPVPGIEREGRRCSEFVQKGLTLARDPLVQTVVIAGSWPGMMLRGDYHDARSSGPLMDLADASSEWVYRQWTQDLAALRREGKRVVIVLSSPRADEFAPKRMVDRGWLRFDFRPADVSRTVLEQQSSFIAPRLRKVAADSGAEIVDPLDHFCVAGNCPSVYGETRRPISTDGSHLREAYVKDHVPYLDPYLLVR
jgi:peptidoglycan/LPS O-acetylase OafA/YrhL